MTYLDTTVAGPATTMRDAPPEAANRRAPLVLVVEDGQALSNAMRNLCGFLDVGIERLDSDEPLDPFLRRYQPMAVIAPMEAQGQDGANVLMAVAGHDATLPVLLLTGGDPALAGAADAVAELWNLSGVVQSRGWPSPGQLAEFLCRAGVEGSCLGLLPV